MKFRIKSLESLNNSPNIRYGQYIYNFNKKGTDHITVSSDIHVKPNTIEDITDWSRYSLNDVEYFNKYQLYIFIDTIEERF